MIDKVLFAKALKDAGVTGSSEAGIACRILTQRFGEGNIHDRNVYGSDHERAYVAIVCAPGTQSALVTVTLGSVHNQGSPHEDVGSASGVYIQ